MGKSIHPYLRACEPALRVLQVRHWADLGQRDACCAVARVGLGRPVRRGVRKWCGLLPGHPARGWLGLVTPRGVGLSKMAWMAACVVLAAAHQCILPF